VSAYARESHRHDGTYEDWPLTTTEGSMLPLVEDDLLTVRSFAWMREAEAIPSRGLSSQEAEAGELT